MSLTYSTGSSPALSMSKQHPHHCFVGAAVQRALERADGAGDGGVNIAKGGGDHARGKGGCVQLVVGVQNQRYVKVRVAVSEGFSPFSIHRKLAACESDGSGATIALPLRMRS